MSTLYTSGNKCQNKTLVVKSLKMTTVYTSGWKCQHYAQVVKRIHILNSIHKWLKDSRGQHYK
jgi:hypothetical protein